MKNTKWSTSSFLKSFQYAINGVKYVLGTQRNILIQSVFGILAIALGFILKISAIDWLILSITIALVLFAEFVNTAIETTVDLFTEEYNEKAKIAKDVAAGGVVITAINSIVVGIIIFCERIINYFLK